MILKLQRIRAEFGLEPEKGFDASHFGSCPFYDKGLYFAVDGTIRSCSNSPYTLASIHDSSAIEKAYTSPLICNRKKPTKELVGKPCSNCHKWDECRGGCRATAEGLGDPLAGYPPLSCSLFWLNLRVLGLVILA